MTIFIIVAHSFFIGKANRIKELITFPNYRFTSFHNIPENDDLKIKTKFNRIIASERYIKTGQVTKYPGEDGKEKTYKPTQEDLEIRSVVHAIEKDIIPTFKRNMFIWMIVCVLSIIVGMLFPQRIYKKSA